MSGKRLNPFQHALIRPDAYIGSIVTKNITAYALDDGEVTTRELVNNAGLFNIIREIGSNVIDNGWRSQKANIPMKSVKVTWDSENKQLSFWNDGAFISTKKHVYEYEDYRKKTITKDELYPAEVFFGEMLAGTNFNDDENVERKTSGRNGLGSKCTVVFSNEFIVRHTDSEAKKQFLQIYTNNGKDRTAPKLTAYNAKTAFTEISFKPDFERFKYDIEDEDVERDFIAQLGMYVLEVAAMTAIPVHFTVNDVKSTYHFKTFDKYVRMLYPATATHKLASITLQNGDECIIIESHTDPEAEIPETLDGIQHVSFVNGIRTKSGGVHVDAWKDAIFPAFVRVFNARKAKAKSPVLKTTAKDVYPYITLFIRTEADKPQFDQQTKDLLNGPPYHLWPEGKTKVAKEEQESVKEDIEKAIVKMLKWNFMVLLEEKLLARTGKSVTKATKVDGRVNFGKKSEDANLAGVEPENCTLWITEGLSAKAFVVRGVSHLERGQDYNGIFAIQGKFINVKKATRAEIEKNPEAPKLMKMLNIKFGVDYSKPENLKTLRYHHIRFATDMDDDGIHIRGLLINLFYASWPQMYEMNMISSLSTGVAKVWFPGRKDKDAKIFFSNPDYKTWYDTEGYNKSINEVKYLKGLAAINAKDVPFYFDDQKIVRYILEGDDKEYMELAFAGDKGAAKGEGKMSDRRKEWILRTSTPDEFTKRILDLNIGDEELPSDGSEEITECSEEYEDEYVYDGDLGLSTFIDRQLIIYHKMALERALPSIIDGLKDGQRKVFYAIRKRNYAKTADLEKVAGAVKEISCYHHGAASLMGTIGNLAIRYPGSNNLALLESDGEFGTRNFGPKGDDSGQPRYISTKLEAVAKLLFRAEDDPILTHNIADDEAVEYEFFLPILCTLLINGAAGIATAWSSNVPNYNPKDILAWTLAWLNEEHQSQPRLIPWYRGINGPIELEFEKGVDVDDPNNLPVRYRSTGILEECCGKGCKTIAGKKKCDGKPGWWHITDLPVGLWTADFKEDTIEYLATCNPPKGTKKKKLEKKCISDYKNYSTANKVHFMIKPTKDWEPEIGTTLKDMTTTAKFTNMVVVDTNNYPLRYDSAEQILEAWCERRLVFYDKRYEYQLGLYKRELLRAKNRYVFVKAVVDKKLNMHQRRDALEKDMLALKLSKMLPEKKENGSKNEEEIDILQDTIQEMKEMKETEENTKGGKKKETGPSFDYLLRMHMWSMTVEKSEELKKIIDLIKNKIEIHKGKTSKDLWKEDLAKFEIGYKKYLNDYPLI
jgi:DNA topoisomerase-2